MGDDIKMTNNILNLYIPTLLHFVASLILFNEATQSNYEISFDEYYTERRVISVLLVQDDIGLAQQINSPKKLIGAHLTRIRSDSPSRNKNIAKLDNLGLRKKFVEIDGQRYPRDS